MDLILRFDKTVLKTIKSNFDHIYPKRVGVSKLNSISLLEFCFVAINHLNDGTIISMDDYLRQIHLLCYLFDVVDVDSRGVLSWDDFTAFCLRMGKTFVTHSLVKSEYMFNQLELSTAVLPINKLGFVNEMSYLYAFDTETSVTRVFNSDGECFCHFDPVEELKKFMHARSTPPATHFERKEYEKKAKQEALQSNLRRKHIITSVAYVLKRKQLVFTTSDGFLIFYNIVNDHHQINGFVKAATEQLGLISCDDAGVLVSWAGDTGEHAFHIWDSITRKLLFKVRRHSAFICSVCEVNLGAEGAALSVSAESAHVDYIASSAIDRTVILWPLTQFTPRFNGQQESSQSSRPIKLRGHTNSIRSLAYAKTNELLVGAGFDFDVYAWDIITMQLHMKLTGHIHSVVRVQIIYQPEERAVTVDEGGVFKVWRLDRQQNIRAEQLQSLQLQLDGQEKMEVWDCVATVAGGNTVAVLASNRIYFFCVDSGDGSRPVLGGLGLCERSGRLWLISGLVITQARLRDGVLIRRLNFNDDDRNGTESNDRVTCTAADLLGKKIFLGTNEGQVLLFDSASLGLLVRIDGESPPGKATDPHGQHQRHHHHHHGHAVAAMVYSDRDELLVTVFSTGDIKIYTGCYRFAAGGHGHYHHHSHSGPHGPHGPHDGGHGGAHHHGHGALHGGHGGVNDGGHGGPHHHVPDGPHHGGNAGPNHHGQGGPQEGHLPAHHPHGIFPHHSHSTHPSHPHLSEAYPGGGGGQLPAGKRCLRECSFEETQDTNVVAMALSEELGLIAVACKNGTVRVYDYLSLILINVFLTPKLMEFPVECTDVCFTPVLPLVLSSDNMGRITIWSTRPHPAKWIYTFCPLRLFPAHRDDTTKREVGNEVEMSGPAVTCFRCDYFREGDVEERKDVPVAAMAAVVGVSRQVLGAVSAMRRRRNSTMGNMPVKQQHKPNPIVHHWKLIVGDEQGILLLVDISALLQKALGYTGEVFAGKPGWAYLSLRRRDISEGLTAAAFSRLQQQLAKPVGSVIDVYSSPPHAVGVLDMQPIKAWIAHSGAVRAISLVRDTRSRHRAGRAGHSTERPPKAPPDMILTASARGVVKNWTAEGNLLGEIKQQQQKAEAQRAIPAVNRRGKRWIATAKAVRENATKALADEKARTEVDLDIDDSDESSTSSSSSGSGSSGGSPSNYSGSEGGSIKTSPKKADQTKGAAGTGAGANGASLGNLLGETPPVVPARKLSVGWQLPQSILSKQPQSDPPDTHAAQIPSTISAAAAAAATGGNAKKGRPPEKDHSFIGAVVAWIWPQLMSKTLTFEVEPVKNSSAPAGDAASQQMQGHAVGEENRAERVSGKGNGGLEGHDNAGGQGQGYNQVYDQGQGQPVHMDALERIRQAVQRSGGTFSMGDHISHRLREFGDSCSHAPLDFSSSVDAPLGSLDGDIFGPYRRPDDDTVDSATAVASHDEAANQKKEFWKIWNLKVRLKNFEHELDTSAFNLIPNPEALLGRQSQVVGGSNRKLRGFDLLVQNQIKQHNEKEKSFDQETQARRTKLGISPTAEHRKTGNTKAREDDESAQQHSIEESPPDSRAGARRASHASLGPQPSPQLFLLLSPLSPLSPLTQHQLAPGDKTGDTSEGRQGHVSAAGTGTGAGVGSPSDEVAVPRQRRLNIRPISAPAGRPPLKTAGTGTVGVPSGAAATAGGGGAGIFAENIDLTKAQAQIQARRRGLLTVDDNVSPTSQELLGQPAEEAVGPRDDFSAAGGWTRAPPPRPPSPQFRQAHDGSVPIAEANGGAANLSGAATISSTANKAGGVVKTHPLRSVKAQSQSAPQLQLQQQQQQQPAAAQKAPSGPSRGGPPRGFSSSSSSSSAIATPLNMRHAPAQSKSAPQLQLSMNMSMNMGMNMGMNIGMGQPERQQAPGEKAQKMSMKSTAGSAAVQRSLSAKKLDLEQQQERASRQHRIDDIISSIQNLGAVDGAIDGPAAQAQAREGGGVAVGREAAFVTRLQQTIKRFEKVVSTDDGGERHMDGKHNDTKMKLAAAKATTGAAIEKYALQTTTRPDVIDVVKEAIAAKAKETELMMMHKLPSCKGGRGRYYSLSSCG